MGKSGIFLLVAIVGATVIVAVMLLPLALGLAIIPHGGGGTSSPAPSAAPAPGNDKSPAKPSKPSKPNDSFSGDGASGGPDVPATTYPVLAKLPYANQYWRLDVLDQGIATGPISLIANIFVQPDANADTEIAKQRPFVEAWLNTNGQPAGTYTVDFQAESVGGG